MEMILATKSSTPIIGQLATVMGWIMDGIYRLLNIFGIQNIGLCIVIFSILIYALMTPLQIKQQKFSKLSAIMQPELQKIQKSTRKNTILLQCRKCRRKHRLYIRNTAYLLQEAVYSLQSSSLFDGLISR